MDLAVVDREFVPFIHKGSVYPQVVQKGFCVDLFAVWCSGNLDWFKRQSFAMRINKATQEGCEKVVKRSNRKVNIR